MTTDPLDRLRASNPVPYGSSAPPAELMLARIHAEDLARRGSRVWARALVPVLGAAAAIAVVALVVVGVQHRKVVRRPVPTARTGKSIPPSSVPVAPAGGMRGLVSL